MNGKQAKRLRKLGREDKAAKAEFNSWTAEKKGQFSEHTDAYLAFARSFDISVVDVEGDEPVAAADPAPVDDEKVSE